MAKVNLTQGEIPAILYGMKVDYHATVTMEYKGKKFFGFKCDKISEALKEKLKSVFPQAEFFVSRSQYAPEIKSGIVAFPRKTRLYMLEA